MFSAVFVCPQGAGVTSRWIFRPWGEWSILGVMSGGVPSRWVPWSGGAMKVWYHKGTPPPGQQAGGTHPTGMLSCFRVVSHKEGIMDANQAKACQPCVSVNFS